MPYRLYTVLYCIIQSCIQNTFSIFVARCVIVLLLGFYGCMYIQYVFAVVDCLDAPGFLHHTFHVLLSANSTGPCLRLMWDPPPKSTRHTFALHLAAKPQCLSVKADCH